MKVIAKNPDSTRNYTTSKRLLAGIVLAGHEAKSIRSGSISLKGSFVRMVNNEPYLVNAHISQYKNSSIEDYSPTKSRKLLLNKREILEIQSAKQNGQTAYPIAIGAAGKFIKLEIGIGRGKKKYDKRSDIKKRDISRSIERKIKH